MLNHISLEGLPDMLRYYLLFEELKREFSEGVYWEREGYYFR